MRIVWVGVVGLVAAGCFEFDPRPDAGIGDEPAGAIAGQITIEGPSGGFASRPTPRPVGRTARATSTSSAKLPVEWKPGAALVLVEPKAYDQLTLAPVLARMLRDAELKDVEVSVVRCSAQRLCTVALHDVGGALLDVERTAQAVDALAKVRAPGVKAVARNLKKWGFRTPNDELYGYQWHFDAIHMNAAWDISVGSPNVVVAVVDSGLVQTHPDINARIARDPINNTLVGADLISDSGLDADEIPGRDTNPEDPGDHAFGAESSWHGTHTAGIIAAETDNGAEGVAGITWVGQLVPVRVLGEGLSGYDDDIIDGLLWAIGDPDVQGVPRNVKPAHVVNLSLGGPSQPGSQEIWDDIIGSILNDTDNRYPQRPLLVAAAGNSDEDAANITPANCAGMITVGAINISGVRADYSNWGTTIDLVAPGGQAGTDLNSDGQDDAILSLAGMEYDLREGTSMAAPQVTGVVALMLSANDTLTQAQVESILKSAADPRGVCSEGCGAGWLDALSALLLSGGEIQLTPLLVADSTSVFFPPGIQTRQVSVVNLGNAPFTFHTLIEGAQAELFDVTPGSGAVDVATQPGGRVTLTVSLARGGFEGGSANLVIVGEGDATGQEAVVNLGFNEDQGRNPRQIQTIEVAAYREGDGGELERVASGTALRDDGFTYQIEGLRAGEYQVFAVGDDNQDGLFDAQRESSGAYPASDEPQWVSVGDDERVEGIDFAILGGFIPEVEGGVGAPCADDDDCRFAADAACITSFTGGYCSRLCDLDGACGENAACEILECDGAPCAVCLLRCVSDAQCRFDDGYLCDRYGTCTPDGLGG